MEGRVLLLRYFIASLFFLLSGSFVGSWASDEAQSIKAYHPVEFLDHKIAAIKKQIFARENLDTNTSQKSIHSRATRNDWLRVVYEHNLVEASELTRNLSDKLIMAKTLESLMGSKKSEEFHPKTMGLKYLLLKNKLLDSSHNLIANRAKVEKAFQKEFPSGFIVKPAAGINSEGKSKGFYFKMDKFFADLFNPNIGIYSASDFSTPFQSPLLSIIASGETFIIQENVVLAAGKKSILTTKEFVEVRVHTLEGKIIPNGSYPRWKETKVEVSQANIDAATDFAQRFLSSLPKEFLQRQAWSIDVAVLENGYLRIIDINTNRGEPIQWSGYLPRPGVLAAYTNFLEENKQIHFAGVSGFLLRNGLGNYPKYLRKVYIEGIR